MSNTRSSQFDIILLISELSKTDNQTCMQVFMSKYEMLDMLEKISFHGDPAKAQLYSKDSIME